MKPDTPTQVADHRGLAGSALVRAAWQQTRFAPQVSTATATERMRALAGTLACPIIAADRFLEVLAVE